MLLHNRSRTLPNSESSYFFAPKIVTIPELSLEKWRSKMLTGHRSSSQAVSEGSMIRRGKSSYAAAVSEPTKDNVPSYRQPVNIEAPGSVQDSVSTFGSPSSMSAIEALNRFPIEVARQPLPRTLPQIVTPMPPYPLSPTYERDQPFDYMVKHDQENLVPDPLTNYYPRMSGPLPIETRRRSPSSPLRFDHSDDYRNISDSLPSSFHDPYNTASLSLSTPNILHKQNWTYVPGHPELSHENSGYTSQPMSRDTSGQSMDQGNERRRASITGTEPMPLLSDFSPKVHTSYQMYMKEEKEREDRPELKRSPPLRFSEPLDDSAGENTAQQRRRFNPMAPSFSPSASTYSNSPNIPGAPPNSTFSNPSLVSSNYSSRHPSPLHTQLPFQPPALTRQTPHQSPRQSPRQIQSPFSPPVPYPAEVSAEAPDMGRTGSGGVRIGPRTVIEFGSGVPGVDVEEARQRAEIYRERIRREKARASGLGIQGFEN